MPSCLFHIRPNSLLSLWYTLLCALIQAWLLFLGFERHRLYTEMQWPTGAFPRLWLTIYAALLGSCIPLLALFLAFGLLKLGNLAGDNEKLGARPRRTIQLVKGGTGQVAARRRHSLAYRLCHCLRSLWTHGPPSAQSVHLLLALVQLFAQQAMLAQLYRFGFINSGDFLNTEMDFLFQRARQLATNLPMGETRLQSFRITSEELAASPLAPNLLPILMHARLFGIPLEFLNLLIALVAFSTTYPAVFWRASRSFSTLFSLFLLVHSVNIVATYLGFSLLFRIQETNFYSPRPVGMGQHLWALRQLPLFHPMALVTAFWLILGLQQLAPMALYAFGYSKFVASQARLRNARRSASALAPAGCSGNSFCDGLTPHVFAITLLLLVAAAKAPAFYAIGMLYYKEERPLLLFCVLADLFYMFVWVLLWCLLTLKCQWRFRVHYDVHELISLADGHKMAEGSVERHRSPAELKNALLLVHGENLFLTDDPMAKPAIMRQVLRHCATQHGDLPHWLRSAAAQMPAAGCQSSLPGTQSPQRRVLNGPSGFGPGQLIGQRTPELGGHYGGRQTLARRESPPVPLAAPPYQRMTSLPPIMDGSQQMQQMQMMPTNSFGTLQARPRHAPGNEYASFSGGPQPVHAGTLSRSYNANQNQQQQPAIPGHMAMAGPICPESYASIHRRASKSSVGSSAGFVGPPMSSPQQLRSARANSLAPARNGMALLPPPQNGPIREELLSGQVGGTQNGQAFEAMSQLDQQRLFDGLQQQRSRMALNGMGGGGSGDQAAIKRVDIQVQQRHQNGAGQHASKQQMAAQHQRSGQMLGPSSFAGPLNGVWQQDGIAEGSLNGGGTTPTGSVTVVSSGSRVGSAASSNTSQATFEQVKLPMNGFNSFGPGAPSSDYGTLTREGQSTLKAGNGQKRNTLEEGGQWRGGPKLTEAGGDFATSVV